MIPSLLSQLVAASPTKHKFERTYTFKEDSQPMRIFRRMDEDSTGLWSVERIMETFNLPRWERPARPRCSPAATDPAKIAPAAHSGSSQAAKDRAMNASTRRGGVKKAGSCVGGISSLMVLFYST